MNTESMEKEAVKEKPTTGDPQNILEDVANFLKLKA